LPRRFNAGSPAIFASNYIIRRGREKVTAPAYLSWTF
jgi:hypothetical protein